MGHFSCSRLRGTPGGRLYTTALAWVPDGLRDECSGRSRSRHLASICGVVFRGARAEQDNGKPACQLFCSTAVKAHLYFVEATARELCHIKFVWTPTMCVDIAYACLLCAMIRVRVCRYVRVCVVVCSNPTFHLIFSFLFALSACCCCCRIMPSVSHRPSSSQVLYFVAATVQFAQQVCVDYCLLTMRVLT